MVVGLARTGLAVARFLKGLGADVLVADVKTESQLGSFAREAGALGIPLLLGPHTGEPFLHADLIVLSPGVPHTLKPLNEARKASIPVWGEVELAARYLEEPIVAITGTNGKTTTTGLVGQMLGASGIDVFVGGNIGNPLIEYVERQEKCQVVVAEVSSFQLDTIETFRPKVAVLLNITADHLDRYEGFEQYVYSKGRLFENQGETDVAVLNGGDRNVEKAAHGTKARKLYFNRREGAIAGARIEGRQMRCSIDGNEETVFDLARFSLPGAHNLENAAAAALAALTVGGTSQGIQRTLEAFKGLHHRVEHVKTVRGVRYYNDSKGTNVGAVERALEGFDVPVILIMGGRDKGGDYAPLANGIQRTVKQLIVIGEAKEKILNALGHLTPSTQAGTLEEAVRKASEAAAEGEVVLLSPGCSSFDMFSDYVQRGEVFRHAVERL